jgi:hypothetical protein
MNTLRFPQLWTMMNAWLNQDYDVEHDDEMLVLDDYASVKRAGDLAATIAELDAMLAGPTDGMLERFIAETGYGNMLIADDDQGARTWLFAARDRLIRAQSGRSPSPNH